MVAGGIVTRGADISEAARHPHRRVGGNLPPDGRESRRAWPIRSYEHQGFSRRAATWEDWELRRSGLLDLCDVEVCEGFSGGGPAGPCLGMRYRNLRRARTIGTMVVVVRCTHRPCIQPVSRLFGAPTRPGSDGSVRC